MSQVAQIEWGMTPTLGRIGAHLKNELRLAGFPDPILGFGEAALKTRKAPPAVIAIWKPSGATGAEWGHQQPSVDPVTGDPVTNLDALNQPVLNALATDLLRLDFYCWAQGTIQDALADADACRYLCHQLWRVIHRLAEGAYRCLGIEPAPEPAVTLGCQAILKIELRTPVVDNLISYVPAGTAGSVTVIPNGAPASDGVTFPSPGVN